MNIPYQIEEKYYGSYFSISFECLMFLFLEQSDEICFVLLERKSYTNL